MVAYPDASPLATVIMSGVTFQCWNANGLPVRPNPVSTSSATSSAPSASHARRTIGQ